jgi:hypothetical protein
MWGKEFFKSIVLEEKMKFKSPMKVTWIIAVIMGVLGTLPVLGVEFPLVSGYSTILLIAAWVLLGVATVVKGL